MSKMRLSESGKRHLIAALKARSVARKERIIDRIERARRQNNRNWMDILRIAVRHAPKETQSVLNDINRLDKIISGYVGQLSESGDE